MKSRTYDRSVLEALLDSWDRNNTILLSLLRALPEGGLEAKVMGDGPSVAELLTHIHYVRLVFVAPAPRRRTPGSCWQSGTARPASPPHSQSGVHSPRAKVPCQAGG